MFKLSMMFLLLAGLSYNAAAQKNQRPEILITIERTGCFGACPIYSAQIYKDGTVKYRGVDFVEIKGKKKHKISAEDVRELIEAFEQADYFSLKDKYESDENGMSVTDQATTTTSIFIDGKRKTIVNYYYAPEKLGKLEKAIDKIARLNQYIKGI